MNQTILPDNQVSGRRWSDEFFRLILLKGEACLPSLTVDQLELMALPLAQALPDASCRKELAFLLSSAWQQSLQLCIPCVHLGAFLGAT